MKPVSIPEIKISEESQTCIPLLESGNASELSKTPQCTNAEFQPASVNSLSTLITHSQSSRAHRLSICCLTPRLPEKEPLLQRSGYLSLRAKRHKGDESVIIAQLLCKYFSTLSAKKSRSCLSEQFHY